MEKDEIRRLYEWIRGRVDLGDATDGITIVFDEPAPTDLQDAGFSDEAIERTLRSDWWPEMKTDILETPGFADPSETPEQVLEYARDVVSEYVWKRL